MEHLGAQNSAKHKEDQLSPKVLQISRAKRKKKIKKRRKYLKENTIKESVKLQNQEKKKSRADMHLTRLQLSTKETCIS